MADPKNKKMDPAGNYNVGYKKPPVEHQFKPSYLRDSAQKTKSRRKEKTPDVAGMIEKSVQVKRGGKTITMHPFEAEVTSLRNHALQRNPPPTKLFFQQYAPP